MKAKVYLVGAGPGDPALLSLKALETLKKANVVLYDRLVSNDVLKVAPSSAKKIFVGKEKGKHAMTQEEINKLLVREAESGKIVVRLKGGDPFLFGRGGEEGEQLSGFGIPFEVVPGVSTAIAAPAYAGIPITHRKHSSSVAIVTGHEDPAKGEAKVKWERLATAVDTIVVLMGVGKIQAIMEQLTKGGRNPDTPVAVIERGTTKGQRTVIGTIRDIAEKARKRGVKPPATIAIGEVVRLRDKLNWFKASDPLEGKVIAVTRPRRLAHKLAKLIRDRGGVPVIAPTVEIRPPSDIRSVEKLISKVLGGGVDYMVFMSANGARATFTVARELGVEDEFAKALGEVRVVAIGPKTQGEIERRNVGVSLVPQHFSSKGLMECLAKLDLSGKTIVLTRAKGVSALLGDELRKRGAEVLEVAVYETCPTSDKRRVESLIRDLIGERVDIITFTSPSGVRNLFAVAESCNLADRLRNKLGDIVVAAIGPTTEEALGEAGVEVDIVPARYTVEDLVEAISEHLRGERRRSYLRS
ncbi:MAG: uroporphyrinogen-III C-methyltransferase [Candidatus Bathyarchaeia archaeon]